MRTLLFLSSVLPSHSFARKGEGRKNSSKQNLVESTDPSRRRREGMEDGGRKEETTAAKVPRGAASFGVSVQEWVKHVKATMLGLVRKATARSEQEAAEADLRTAKMQVEATDEAEAKKKQLTG